MQSPRAYIGAVFRVTLDLIEQKRLTAKVRAAAKPATAALIDRPPSRFSWHDAVHLEEMEVLLARLGGRGLCTELGRVAARDLAGSIVEPVLRMAMSLFGKNPGVVYSNLDRFYGVVARGLSFAYERRGSDHGIVRMRAEGAGVPAELFEVTRGNLEYGLELCGRTGTVSPPVVEQHDHSGAALYYTVSWS